MPERLPIYDIIARLQARCRLVYLQRDNFWLAVARLVDYSRTAKSQWLDRKSS
jgi:hypothetical protein